MKLRSLAITVGLLGIAAVAAHYLTRTPPLPPADTRVGQALVEPAILDATARIKLTDNAKTVDLSRDPDGTWKVVSYYDLPADFSKINTLTSSLANSKLDKFIRGTPERLARMEFKDTQIQLLDTTGKELWSMSLGKNADNGGRFLKLGAEANAFVANLSVWLDSEPRNWADTALLRVKPEDVLKLEVSFGDGHRQELARAKGTEDFSAADLPAGKVLKKSRITSLLSTLTNLRFSQTSATDDAKVVAAQAQTRVMKLTTADGKVYTIALSRALPPSPSPTPTPAPGATPLPATPTPPNPVFVKVTTSESTDAINASMAKRAFEVYEYTYNQLPAKLDDWLEAAPSPSPAPTIPPALAAPPAPAASAASEPAPVGPPPPPPPSK